MKIKKPTQDEIRTAEHWGTWEKEASVFPWFYEDKETCYILEGKVKVTDETGNSIEFEEGDWVEFPKGLQCTWHVIRDVKKKYKFG
jgi:uncharacterized protein